MKTTKYSAKALIIDTLEAGRVLLIKERLSNGTLVYDLPGGGIEVGETKHQALVRELTEELGITVEVGKELGEYTFDDGRTGVTVVCYTFLCRFDSHKTFDLEHNPAENEKIIAAEWWSIEEVLGTELLGIVPSLRVLLEKAKAL